MSVMSITNAEHYVWGEVCEGWHLLKSENLSVIQERVPAGSCEVKHFHKNAEQFFYVLSGVATMILASSTETLAAGQGIHIAPGDAHQLCNNGSDELIILVISTPPSHGDRVVV